MDIGRSPFQGRYVIDREWSVRVGPLHIARSHRCYGFAACPGPAPVAALSFFGRAAIGIGTLCLGMFATIAFVGGQVGARTAYAISIPVPPNARPVSPVRRHHSPHETTRRAANPALAKGTVVAAVPTSAQDDPDVSRQTDIETVSDSAPSRDAAVQAALVTGDLQQWHDASDRNGFVVAGPLQAGNGKQCRNLAVLIRSVDVDTVEQRHDCLR